MAETQITFLGAVVTLRRCNTGVLKGAAAPNVELLWGNGTLALWAADRLLTHAKAEHPQVAARLIEGRLAPLQPLMLAWSPEVLSG